MCKRLYPAVVAMLLLLMPMMASALTVDGSGQIVNWGFTPGYGPYMGNWANGVPPETTGQFGTDSGETTTTAWTEGNNCAPIDYPLGAADYVPTPGGDNGEKFDMELLAWRVLPGNRMQVLMISSINPAGGIFGPYPYHVGDVFIDVDNDGEYDRALTAGQWTTAMNDPIHDDDDPTSDGVQTGYRHTMDFGLYSVEDVHGITGPPVGEANYPYIAEACNPFALMSGVNQGGNLAYAAVRFNYGGFQGISENNTWILEWTFDIAALGELPIDPETGMPSLKSLSLHATNEMGKDFIDRGPRQSELPTGEIGDTVFFDKNNDGIQQDGEPGIANVKVVLDFAGGDGVLNTADDIITNATTDEDGNYLFSGLPQGLFAVCVDDSTVPAEYKPGKTPKVYQVDLGLGEEFLDADFAYIISDPGTGQIGDTVFFDKNNDGIQQDSDPGIPNVKVVLTFAGADNQLGTGDDVIKSAVTDMNGKYLFTGLLKGLYTANVDASTVPNTYIPGQTPAMYQINLGIGQSYLDADFAYICRDPGTGQIGDTVFFDKDNDGVQQAGEPGIANVKVVLTFAGPDEVLGTGDDVIKNDVTDASGKYLFTSLLEGLYTVNVDNSTVPSTYVPGKTPSVYQITLSPAQVYLDADFAYICNDPGTGKIGDTVFCDKNNDGVQQTYEAGIGNVKVVLTFAGPDNVLGTGDDIVKTTFTNTCGKYLFTGLLKGLYSVRVDNTTVPAGIVPGKTPAVYQVNLAVGQSYLDADFAYICQQSCGKGQIGDTVFCDKNNDGRQQSCENGIANVKVVLDYAGSDNILGNGDDTYKYAITDCRGKYLFTSLRPGLYSVRVEGCTVPSGMMPGKTPSTYQINLRSGQSYLDADFAYICRCICNSGKIGDTVFIDKNNDGVQQSGEPGIPNVKVILNFAGPDNRLGTRDDVYKNAVTDASGKYLFKELCKGLYAICVDDDTVPASYVMGNTPSVYQVKLASGQVYLDADFAYICKKAPGTGTPGYWKNHASAWPVGQITIGCVTYSKCEAIRLMQTCVSNDKTYNMFQALVSAKLNVLVGNESSCINDAIAKADAWMKAHPVGSKVSACSSAWTSIAATFTKLDDYNNGRLCAPSREALGH